MSYRDSWELAEREFAVGEAGLFQYGDLACGKHHCQLVGESFLLPDGDYAILFFLYLVHDLYSLPEGNMTLVITSKDTIQKS
jgi:hypothetical protein